MMIIQSIVIRWTKETRGEPYASLRSQQPAYFPLPNDMMQQRKGMTNEQNAHWLWHQLAFEQTKQKIKRLHEHYEWLPVSNDNMQTEGTLPGMSWKQIDGRVSVHACYDHSFGKPIRTNGQSGLLDEQVFELLPFQYGQIIFNGRHTLEDGSLYEQRVLNIWNVVDYSKVHRLKNVPDYQYKQLAALW